MTNRRDELRRQIERAQRELEKLDALPDFEVLANGTVMALFVTLGRSQPYTFIGYKTRNRWYLTGSTSPNSVSSEELARWLTTSSRQLVTATVLAEIEATAVPVADLGAALSGLLDGLRPRP